MFWKMHFKHEDDDSLIKKEKRKTWKNRYIMAVSSSNDFYNSHFLWRVWVNYYFVAKNIHDDGSMMNLL